MEKEKIVPEADAIAPKAEDNSTAAPAEEKEAIDPRIVEIVGEEEVKSAFGEQPKTEEKPADEKKEVPIEEPKKEDQEEKVEDQEVEVPKITPPEPKPTRLDRRLVDRYIHNLHLMGEANIPTEEAIMADLKKYSKEEKIQALHFHLQKEKELRGEKPTGNDLDEEDNAAIQDADRETIRQEILAEEYQKNVMSGFAKFIEEHTELLPDDQENKKKFPDKKAYDPTLAKAVETLWRGGMLIDEAFNTVNDQIQAVKEAKENEEKKEKDKALSGVLSGTGQVPQTGKELTWDDASRIEKEDPQLYRKMLKEGKFKHLM